MRRVVTASEALYAFASWLTARPGTLVIGSRFDASHVVDLVAEYIEFNEWNEPRDGWHNFIKHPPHRKGD